MVFSWLKGWLSFDGQEDQSPISKDTGVMAVNEKAKATFRHDDVLIAYNRRVALVSLANEAIF
jgi:hypothetical protein